MTCIIGLVHEGKVYMGADSAGVEVLSLTIRRDPKMFYIGQDFLLGFTTSFRMGQLLGFQLKPPDASPKEFGLKYMSTSFADAMRECFRKGGYLKVENGVESGGAFLVGWRRELYCIGSDFQVEMSHNSFMAVGSGSDIALGAMYASAGKKPKERIMKALEAAANFNAGVHPPFHVLSL